MYWVRRVNESQGGERERKREMKEREGVTEGRGQREGVDSQWSISKFIQSLE